VGIKDIPCPQLLSKFGPKTWKYLVIGTYLKKLYCPKRHLGPLGVKIPKKSQNKEFNIVGGSFSWHYIGFCLLFVIANLKF